MPYRKDIFFRGGYYHIYNRGAGKQKVFFNEGNYLYLLSLLKKHSVKWKIGIVSYCLMPNHYHLLVWQGGDVPVSKFVNSTFISYTQAVNIQQQRSGTLFQGRFKHRRVEKQEYLLHLIRYIHANPVVAGIVERPEEWKFSDYSLWVADTQTSRKVNLHDQSDLNDTSNFIDDLAGSTIKQDMYEWHHKRIKYFRRELDIPTPDEYKKFVKDYQELKAEQKEFDKYLFD